MIDNARLLGELAAISEMAQKVEQAARVHRAAGRLDAGYLTALEDMMIALREMLKARQEPTVIEAPANLLPGNVTFYCGQCGYKLPDHRPDCRPLPWHRPEQFN